MKIAIFETEHFEAAYPLVRLFDNGSNGITIFSYPPAQRQLAYLLADTASRYTWITKKENQSHRSFIQTMKKEVKERKIELLYLNTVSDNYLFYALLARSLPNIRIILTVHMINSLFETRNTYKPRRLFHAIGKWWLRNTIKEYNVLAHAMVAVLKERSGNNKKIHNIPGGIYEGREPHTILQQPLHIVVPGSIDLKRRNYSHAIRLLELLQKENVPVKMTLLGRFADENYGNMVRSMAKPFEGKIHFYGDEEIDQGEFDRVLESADFLFSPIGFLLVDGVYESYGTTISSGNMSDAIRHAKPIFIPANTVIVDALLEPCCIRYREIEDIADFLAHIAKDSGEYRRLTTSALKSAKEYTIEKVRERNRDVFQ